MSKLDYLIPGLESFMEDTEVNVEVAVGDPEDVVEEQVEAEESSAEVAEVAEEAEATEEQTEMIMAHFAELEHRLNHVRQYGVDRTFMRLFNSNGELARACNLNLPGCESFDTVGDSYSAESQAVIAGLENVFSKIWDFIKKLAAKVAGFFRRIYEAIATRVGNVHSQIGRLRERLKELVDDPDALKESKATTWDMAMVKKTMGAWEGAFDFKGMKFKGYKSKGALDLGAAIDEVSKIVASDDKKALDDLKKRVTDFVEGFGEMKKDADKIFQSGKEKPVARVKFDELGGILDEAARWAANMETLKAMGQLGKTISDKAKKIADQAEARKDADATAQRAAANTVSKIVNGVSGAGSAIFAAHMKCIRAAIQIVSRRMQFAKKA